MSAVRNICARRVMCDYSKYVQTVFWWNGNNYFSFLTVRFWKRFSHAGQKTLNFLQELNRALILEGFQLEIHTD